MSENQPKRDLVLPPGTYAYMQDVTKGVVKTYTGPTVINPTAQEQQVVYDAASNMYRRATTLEESMKISPIAKEGSYIILRNPAKGNKHPEDGSAQPSAELEIGRAIIVPGPATFALWPGQIAEVVDGHHLRSNQYLLIRVYNEEEAKKNWTKAVVKSVTGEGEPAQPVTSTPPPDLTIGKQLIIRGTEVSFYIPPTGIEVVVDPSERRARQNDEAPTERYVRDALTLERLEYAILVDENGKKRYETGPQVVFPLPTERFVEVKDEGVLSKKFRAIELNPIQGLHIKVIAPYTENGKKYNAGDELFITGKDTAIYYPREEHSALKYDGKAKHFATAVPAGEARYVMDRLTGEIRTIKGPAMLLPDPRHEVIVRRVLSDRQCDLWYPGNQEALEYNRGLRSILQNVPTTRQGAVSEGDIERGARKSAKGAAPVAAALYASTANSVMEVSRVSGEQNFVGDEISRSSNYTQPRTVTLETKYQGAPQIDVWTGYAVMVVSKTGKRRVERGPTTVLLEYDETLEILELSTGKPKTTDTLLRVPYLRIDNNKVSDIINIETSDHVQVQIYLGYLVDFVNPHPIPTAVSTPEQIRAWQEHAASWFSVENYVKFLCDHVRSVLKGRARKLRVEDFYANSTDHIRDFILGKSENGKRAGMMFEQNGMRVTDVEVLKVRLEDEKIRPLLDAAQHEVVRTNIELSTLARGLEVTKQKEAIKRDEDHTRAETKRLNDQLQVELAASELAVTLARLGNQLKQIEEDAVVQAAASKTADFKHDANLARVKRERDQEAMFEDLAQDRKIALLKAEAESIVQRFQAVSGNFSEALLALSRNETLIKVAQAWDVQKTIAGETLAGTLKKVFDGTPLGGIVEKLVQSNGAAKPTTTAAPVS